MPALVGTLAIVATGTAIGRSVLAGWQRGGWLPERVAVGVMLVVSGHFLPALCGVAPARVRWMEAILWATSMAATCYGHATFFLLRVMRKARDMLTNRAGLVFSQMEKAIGASYRRALRVACSGAHACQQGTGKAELLGPTANCWLRLWLGRFSRQGISAAC